MESETSREMSASSYRCLQRFLNYFCTSSASEASDLKCANSFSIDGQASSSLDEYNKPLSFKYHPASPAPASPAPTSPAPASPAPASPALSGVSDDPLLGQGGFAVVRKVRLRDGLYIAVKTTNDAKQLSIELDLLAAVQRHPNIVPLVETTLSGVITMEVADCDLLAVVSTAVKLPEAPASQHWRRLDAEAGEALSCVADSGAVHVEDVLQMPPSLWTLGRRGGKDETHPREEDEALQWNSRLAHLPK